MCRAGRHEQCPNPSPPNPTGLQEAQGTSQDTRGPEQPPSHPEGHRRGLHPGSMLRSGREAGGHWRDEGKRTQKPGCWPESERAAFGWRNEDSGSLGTRVVVSNYQDPEPGCNPRQEPSETLGKGRGRKKMVAEASESSVKGGGCPGGRQSVAASPGQRGVAKVRTADKGRRGQSNFKTKAEEHKISFIKGNCTLILL